jgi:hypothetical protein
MTISPALAGDGALAPGKPAGVKQAQHHGPSLLLIGGAALVTAVAVVVAVEQSNNSSCSTTNCPTASSTGATS